MAALPRLDPEERAAALDAHRHALALKAVVDRLFERASPDLRAALRWLAANVDDAASDLAGLIADSEPRGRG